MKISAIIFAIFIFLLFDSVFLYLNHTLFSHQIIDVQRVIMIPKPIGIVVTYCLILFAFYFFILRTHRPVFEAALLGGIINGTYELTNYSLFKKWKLHTVILDTLWGAASWGTVTYFTYELFK